jgi:uncharacterized membrane protein YhaH (DUF805 family)
MQAPTMQPIGATGQMVIVSGRPANMMNPIDSVITCFQKYVGFEGRASRSEYWWFYLAYFIALIITNIADGMIFGIKLTDPTPITLALQLGIFLPILAVTIRRMHDHGKSGWYGLVPFYNLYLLIAEGEAVPNIYGPVPTNIREGDSGTSYVIVQQPMQQQYQQPTAQTATQVSDDGYWALIDGSWAPTELQNEAIAKGANPHAGNMHIGTIPQASEQYVLNSSPSSGGLEKTLIVTAGIVIGIALLVVLAGVLYVWASSLAASNTQDSNLVGDWTNPYDKLELQSDGNAKESTGAFESWYNVGENLYFEDEEYSYKYRYSLVDDILFLAPYDGDGVLSEEDCTAYLQGSNGESESHFNDRIEQAQSNGKFPNWCNP